MYRRRLTVGSMARFRFGCSGWDYQEWIGPFYRNASESKLRAYARVFDTAEINSTFYRGPWPGMVQGWGRFTPDDFVFAAKVPQTVTHDRLLDVAAGADKDLLSYCDLMRPLLDQGKLGPLLLQLPPRLRFDETVIHRFLDVLPRNFTFALEPRNKSWMTMEAFDLLRSTGVAYTIVDAALGRLMDPNRLDRAKRIDSKDVEVTREGEVILARVKEYRVELDPTSKTIVHDCEDWGKLSGRKDFCKHVGKFFLSLPKEEALTQLDAIATDRDAWTFSTPPT